MSLAEGAPGGRSTNSKPHFLLYGRAYCHLCHEMEQALELLQNELSFSFKAIDLDERPELEARLGELIPVLELSGQIVCHYHLDEQALRAYLLEFR